MTDTGATLSGVAHTVPITGSFAFVVSATSMGVALQKKPEPPQAGTNVANQAISVNVTGLTPQTKYFFRLVEYDGLTSADAVLFTAECAFFITAPIPVIVDANCLAPCAVHAAVPIPGVMPPVYMGDTQ